MTLEEKIKKLPPQLQQETEDFVEEAGNNSFSK